MIKRNKPLRRTPIRRVSKKRQRDMREYARLRKEFLEENPVDQIWLAEHGFKMTRDPMTGWYETVHGICYSVNELLSDLRAPHATEVHHRAKRGKNYLNVSTWLALGRENHERVEQNKSWARAQGFLDNI
jgi:hypothetical protein